MRRKFIKLFSVSVLSLLLLPYKFLYAVTKKIINQNLTDEQKYILFNEGTERPFTSSLLHEKRDGFYHCANCDAKLFSSDTNTIVEQVGHHLPNLYPAHLKLKLIIH